MKAPRQRQKTDPLTKENFTARLNDASGSTNKLVMRMSWESIFLLTSCCDLSSLTFISISHAIASAISSSHIHFITRFSWINCEYSLDALFKFHEYSIRYLTGNFQDVYFVIYPASKLTTE